MYRCDGGAAWHCRAARYRGGDFRPSRRAGADHCDRQRVDPGTRLYGRRRHPKELWEIPEAGHGSGLAARPDEYAERIATFFDRALEPGNTFTVEPGVYLPGVGGVRIEDNVLITENGAETLTTFPRELQSIGR